MEKALPAASGRQAGGEAVFTVSESDLPLAALGPRTALAVISNTEGSAYRPRGAGMAVAANGAATGHLSSGCIDKDVALHMRAALRDGRLRRLRYGLGSPFRDLELPCGGGLEILIQPRLDLPAISHARAELAATVCSRPAPAIPPQERSATGRRGPEGSGASERRRCAAARRQPEWFRMRWWPLGRACARCRPEPCPPVTGEGQALPPRSAPRRFRCPFPDRHGR